MINRALILTDEDTDKYYLCVLDDANIESEDDIPVAELSLPAGTESFTPFYYDDVTFILTSVITSSSASKIANYPLPVAPIVTGTTVINPVDWGNLFIKLS